MLSVDFVDSCKIHYLLQPHKAYVRDDVVSWRHSFRVQCSSTFGISLHYQVHWNENKTYVKGKQHSKQIFNWELNVLSCTTIKLQDCSFNEPFNLFAADKSSIVIVVLIAKPVNIRIYCGCGVDKWKGPVTDLRIDQIGHGQGPRAFGGPRNSVLWRLNINYKFAKLRRGITSQFTLKRAEMQISTLDFYQYSNNTTILCIWAWARYRPSVWKWLQKKNKKEKKRYLCRYNVSLTKSSQQRKTARYYKTPMKSNIISTGFYVWLFLTRFPANWDCLLKLYVRSSKHFVRRPHKLLHNSPEHLM